MASSLAPVASRELPLTNHTDSTFSYQVRHFHHHITGWMKPLNEPNKPWKEVTIMTPFSNKDIPHRKSAKLYQLLLLKLSKRNPNPNASFARWL